MVLTIKVSDDFEGGNVEYVTQRESEQSGVVDVVLRIKPDLYTELEEIRHMQYFSFRVDVVGVPEGGSRQINYVLENAEKASYPEAWQGTTVCYTKSSGGVEDVDSWRRNCDTFYRDGKLSWEHLHSEDGTTYFSYFPPFTYERHQQLIAKCRDKASATSGDGNDTSVDVLGKSLEGRDIECIRTGTGPMTCWVIHRQHPGETMAEHYAEGFLTVLLGLDDKENGDTDSEGTAAKARKLRELYTFYVVPCMCPDGGVRGHLRTNGCGANLNREWATKGQYEAPTEERSPEVFCVLRKMDETGCDLFLDVHGDEELPYNFISGAEKTPRWNESPRLQALHGAFVAAYSRANSDMQQAIGYPPPESAEGVLGYMNVATNQVSNRFNCLGMTLEMPYKDCLSNSDPDFGWTPARCRKLAASVLDPMEYVHPYLRSEEEFWNSLPPEDAYVETTDDYQHEKDTAEDPERFIMLKKRYYSDVHEIHKPVHGKVQ